jgi:hypothetical protein
VTLRNIDNLRDRVRRLEPVRPVRNATYWEFDLHGFHGWADKRTTGETLTIEQFYCRLDRLRVVHSHWFWDGFRVEFHRIRLQDPDGVLYQLDTEVHSHWFWDGFRVEFHRIRLQDPDGVLYQLDTEKCPITTEPRLELAYEIEQKLYEDLIEGEPRSQIGVSERWTLNGLVWVDLDGETFLVPSYGESHHGKERYDTPDTFCIYRNGQYRRTREDVHRIFGSNPMWSLDEAYRDGGDNR